MTVRRIVPLLLVNLVLFGCAAVDRLPGSLPGKTSTPVASPTPTAAVAAVATATATPVFTPSETSTPAASSSPTSLPSATPVPTYAILRGTVNEAKVSCRYGPGAMYLYLYGLNEGANQDVIGRTDTGKWVLTRARGDNKACWVKASLRNIKGDVMSVQMVYPDLYHIPPSNQGYLAPWDVAAVRHGNQVVISWKSEALRPGDEESATSVLYVVETWTCVDGQVTFNPVGAYASQVTVADEPGCSQPSHGRVFFSEKHGYAGPSTIPWPAAGAIPAATATP